MNINGIDGAKFNDLMVNNQKSNKQMTTFQSILDQQLAEKPIEDKALKDTCKEFEAYYYREMLKSMRKTVPDSGLIEKSPGHQIFQDMLDDEYAQMASEKSSMGLAQMLYKQLSSKTK